MARGKAHGRDREYQVFSRDVLRHRASLFELRLLAGEWGRRPHPPRNRDTDLRCRPGRPLGRIVVAERKRWKGRVKLEHFDSFAYRVELLRQVAGVKVAALCFARTAYQRGAVKAAAGDGVPVTVCAEGQPLDAFALTFQYYDSERARRYQPGEVFLTDRIEVTEGLVSIGGVILFADSRGRQLDAAWVADTVR